MKWCSQVFPDPLPVVSQLTADTLGGLDPALHECIETYLTEKGEPLVSLIELKQVLVNCNENGR